VKVAPLLTALGNLRSSNAEEQHHENIICQEVKAQAPYVRIIIEMQVTFWEQVGPAQGNNYPDEQGN
jgi:hypothetical protein